MKISLSGLRGALRITWMLVVTSFVVVYAVRNWPKIAELTPQIGVVTALGIVAVTMAGKFVVSEQLRLSAELLGTRLSVGRAYRIYTSSDLAKYVPGGVWNAVARVKLLRDEGASSPSSGKAFALDKLWQITGAFFSGILLCRAVLHERLLGGIIDDSSAIRVVSIIIVVALWLATTAVLNRVLAPTQQPSRALRRAIVDQSVIALLLGLGLWLPLRALGAGDVLLVVGAFALGRAAGYAAVFAPAGVGVREAVALWILSSAGTTEVVLIALAANRLFTVAADLLSYGLALMTTSKPSSARGQYP